MPPMQRFVHLALILVLGGAAACGSVKNTNPDGATGDGATTKPGELIWVRSMSAAFGQGVADGPGGLLFTSSITAPTDFGGGLMTPMGKADLAIGDFKADDASYTYQVRQNDASMGSVYGFLQQTDALGNPLVYGVSYGDVDLGKGHVRGGGGPGADGFIGRYGPSAPAWVNQMVGPGEDKILCTATAPGGDVYAGGYLEQTTTWNNAQLTSAGGRDMFLSRMNTFTGVVSTTKQFGGTGREEISSLAGDGTNLIVGGFFDGTLALGAPTQPLIATRDVTGAPSLDAMVAKLDDKLTPVWAVRFGGTGEDRGAMVALGKTGDVFVAGQFQNQVAFGALNFTAAGMHDIFVVKLHGESGAVAWAVQLGGPSDDVPNRIIVDNDGNVALIASTNNDALIESLDPSNGSVRWKTMVATTGTDYGWTMSLGSTGDLYAVVNLGGPFNFGKPLIGPPAAASVVMRIAP
jgi:Beta-propeller repeat